MINQKALCKLISKGYKSIVNPKADNFEYCNGYMVVMCDYDQHEVIHKLFKMGIVSNYKKWEPVDGTDLSGFLTAIEEVPAEKTSYLKVIGDKVAVVFKIGERYFFYNKNIIDVWENVIFKADNVDKYSAMLRIYEKDKLVGIALNMRDIDEESLKEDMKVLK
jgi:hypothetical protein